MKKIELDGLVSKVIGKEIYYYDEIDSTQKEVWRRIEGHKELKNGTIILADVQTAGVGTHGRNWYTSQKGNIAFSIVLFPDCNADKLKNVTKEIAKIFVDIFHDFYKVEIEIKPPNDLIINKRKVGGILTETKLSGENVKILVIGVGINITKKDFEEDIKYSATSISKEYKIKIDNDLIISEFCNRFERFLNRENVL